MLPSPPYGALCTKYRALIAENIYIFCYIYVYIYINIYIYIYIAEMQKRKRPILCYSEFRAKALVRQTITLSDDISDDGYGLSDECLRTKLRVTENRSFPFLHFCYQRSVLCT